MLPPGIGGDYKLAASALLLQRRIGFHGPDDQKRQTLAFLLSAWNIIHIAFFFWVRAGPQVPSVAVYRTEDKQSE